MMIGVMTILFVLTFVERILVYRVNKGDFISEDTLSRMEWWLLSLLIFYPGIFSLMLRNTIIGFSVPFSVPEKDTELSLLTN